MRKKQIPNNLNKINEAEYEWKFMLKSKDFYTPLYNMFPTFYKQFKDQMVIHLFPSTQKLQTQHSNRKYMLFKFLIF